MLEAVPKMIRMSLWSGILSAHQHCVCARIESMKALETNEINTLVVVPKVKDMLFQDLNASAHQHSMSEGIKPRRH